MDTVNRHGDSDDVLRLVERCQAGDEAAFEKLYLQFADRVLRHLAVLLGPSADLDDSVQLVFVEAFRHIHRYNRTSKFSTWLHGIAVNVALNTRRGHRRRERAMQAMADEHNVIGSGVAEDPERRVADTERLLWLHRKLEKVAPKKRAAFLLYYVEHLEVAEVAALVGASHDTTLARIKHARAEIRAALEREDLAQARRLGSPP